LKSCYGVANDLWWYGGMVVFDGGDVRL